MLDELRLTRGANCTHARVLRGWSIYAAVARFLARPPAALAQDTKDKR